MEKQQKERVVEELTERLRETQTLIVADYRGLTMPQIDGLRSELLKHGARFRVVKNTLTRRAAEEAGADAVLALLEGPSAIAFLETDGDPVAVAKALGAAARETRVLEVKGGLLDGRAITAADVENLAKLPPLEQLRGQVLGAITAPVYTIVGLFTAPLQNLVGLIDARIEQLRAEGDDGSDGVSGSEPQASGAPAAAASEAEGAGEEAVSGSEPQSQTVAVEDASAEATETENQDQPQEEQS
jgi:large subunit ribosomal protein L10